MVYLHFFTSKIQILTFWSLAKFLCNLFVPSVLVVIGAAAGARETGVRTERQGQEWRCFCPGLQ